MQEVMGARCDDDPTVDVRVRIVIDASPCHQTKKVLEHLNKLQVSEMGRLAVRCNGANLGAPSTRNKLLEGAQISPAVKAPAARDLQANTIQINELVIPMYTCRKVYPNTSSSLMMM
eukprot:1159404-Pelagomonas_calceolata.AAC.10